MIGEELQAIRADLTRFVDIMRPALPPQLREYIEDTGGLLRRLTCRIAVIGQIKAGKSTFINAFVDRPSLLPTHVSPWTTAVTHLHFGCPDAPPETAAKFTFFDAQEWTKLVVGGGRIRDLTSQFVPGFEADLLEHHVNALRRRSELRLGPQLNDMLGTTREFQQLVPDLLAEYVCAGDFDGSQASSVGKYSDIVKKADLYFPCNHFSFPTTVIDTPGTNDPFLVRDEITRQSLDAADMYIVLLTARQALSSADVALLRILHGLNKERVLIFISRIDELTNVADDCEEIVDDVRQRLRKEFPGNEPRIIAGSAHWAQMAREHKSIDVNNRSSRSVLAYAARIGVSPLAAAPSDGTLPSSHGILMGCSGLPELNRAVSDMMLQSHAGHVMRQVAATLKELSQVGPPILLREIRDLEAEDGLGEQKAESAEAEYRSIESDIRDNERTLLAIHALQVDMQARTLQVVEDQRALMEDFLGEAVDDFAARECASLAHDLADAVGQRIWTSRPSDLRRLLEATYVKQLRKSEDQLLDLESGTVARLQSVIASLNIEVPHDEQKRRSLDLRSLPLGALRRVIALDLGESWWKRWWSGPKSNAERIAELEQIIRQEFDPIVIEMADVAHAQLSERRAAILNRLTMLSLSLIEAFQELSDRRARRLRELASEGDPSKILERKNACAARIAQLKAYVSDMRKVADEIDRGEQFKAMQLH